MLLLILFFPILSFSEKCTFSMSCEDNLDQKTCLKKTKTDSEQIFEIKLNPIHNQNKYYCNIYDSLINTYEQEIEIQPYSNYFLSTFPGGTCKNHSDCLYGICINNTCVDSLKKTECFINENCPLNQACINHTCSDLLGENKKCNFSTDCEFNLYCNKKSKKCQKLFSFEDGADITDEFIENERPELLCKNGGYYINESNNYICASLLNVNNECYNDCEYIIKGKKNKTIHIPEKCLCGFNKYRSKHCVLGNGEEIYKEFLKEKKKFINNKTLTSFCHTTERFNDDICIELQINRKVSFRKYVQKYNNLKILSLEHHRLQNSDECVKNLVFNYNTLPIIPDQMSCPIVKCNDTLDYCAYGYNPFNEEGNELKLELNDKKCKKDEKCYLNSFDERYFINNLFDNNEIFGTCRKTKNENSKMLRYPGEKCDKDLYPCINGIECVKGKCKGKKKNEDCVDFIDCEVGLFCNSTNMKCENQKDEGEYCKDSWECKNYLGCYKNNCIKYGSLKSNMKNTVEESLFSNDEEKRYYLCEYGKLDSTKTYCVTTDYDSDWFFNYGKVLYDNKFIECKKDEYCYYTEGVGNFSLKCSCGYNEKGKGYCPIPININKYDWKKRIRILGEMTNNKCHSLNRFHCYLSDTYENYVISRNIALKTTDAHLFVNSPQCVFDMFGSGKELKWKWVLGILAFIIF